MNLALEMALTILLAATLNNCALVGAAKNKLLKSVPVSGGIHVAAISPDGTMLAAVDNSDLSSGKYPIKVIQVEDGRTKYSTDRYPVYGLAFSPDGAILAAAGRDGVRLFRSADGHLLRTLEGNQLFTVAFSRDGQMLAAGGAEGRVDVWRVSDGTLMHKNEVGRWITSLAFSSNNQLLAIGTSSSIGHVQRSQASTEDNAIVLWPVGGDKPLATLGGHKYAVVSLAFNATSTALASGGSDGIIKLWSIQEKTLIASNQIASAAGADVPVSDLAFSPDNKALAIACNRDVVLVDSAQLNTLDILEGHTRAVLRVHFNRDGSVLESVSEDQTIRIWKLH